jgi:phage-related tail fiber protein
MANTTNFNWETPDDTDLVKDGAAAIRTLGNSIDTSFIDLKGGTTGQILSKASNTDLDYTWIANDQGDITEVTVSSPLTGGGSSGSVNVAIQDGTTAQKGAVQLEDSTSSTSTTKAATPNSVKSSYDLANAAIPKSLVDAAGDLIYATANDTLSRLGIGTAGQVLKVNSGATAPEWGAGGSSISNGRSFVATDQSTTSTSYTDLATSQSVTLTTGTKVLVLFNMGLYSNTVNQSAMASVAVSGATTTSASDDWAIKLRNDGTDVSQDWIIGRSTLLTCTAGSNTFTLKFKSTNGSATANFFSRELIVIDLGS